MNHTVISFQLGITPEQKPALVMTFDNGESQTILFSLDSAKQLGWGLAELCERLTPSTAFADGTNVGDGCSLSLSPPKED